MVVAGPIRVESAVNLQVDLDGDHPGPHPRVERVAPGGDVASAASRPAAHWGTFTKAATGNSCLSMARKALFDQGYETQNAGYMVMGFSNTVTVSVVCVPRQQNTWVAVNAYSDDTQAAELARNRVREQIVRMVMID
jgi:hypothetical protein